MLWTERTDLRKVAHLFGAAYGFQSKQFLGSFTQVIEMDLIRAHRCKKTSLRMMDKIEHQSDNEEC